MNLSIDQAIQYAAKMQNAGNLPEAERLYGAILQAHPNQAAANHNLGLIAVSQGLLKTALPRFKIAVDVNPDIEQFWISYIEALIADRQFEKAKKVMRKAKRRNIIKHKFKSLSQKMIMARTRKTPSEEEIKNHLQLYKNLQSHDAEKLAKSFITKFPTHPIGWKLLGTILGQAGRISESLNVNQKAVELSPKDTEAQNNLGASLQKLGRLNEAVVSFKQAIALDPKYAAAHYNLGNTLQDLGKLDEAEKSYTQAIKLKPTYIKAHSNLGVTLQKLGRLDEAKERYQQLLLLDPDYAPAYNNLGGVLQELKKSHQAEVNYRKAITLTPNVVEVHLNLIGLLEQSNKLDETSLAITHAKEAGIEWGSDFLTYEALIFFRKEDYEMTDNVIKKIDTEQLSKKVLPLALKLKADWYHFNKHYDSAFQTFKKMNDSIKNSEDYKDIESEQYFNQQKDTLLEIKQLQDQSPHKAITKSRCYQPTFIIGFPRSGTTLLDTILRTHSKINVLEERPMVEKMCAHLNHLRSVSMIENIKREEAEIASGLYFKELEQHIKFDKNHITVDKLPLNILQIPLIHSIFPEAKFIVALRHPFDCILSCWMQNFGINPAMANMVDLDRVVDFYCTAMEILKISQQRYPLNIHKIRYEDLILDFKTNVSSILTFLNLDWEKELTNYQSTALARGTINTPSYSQVVKPIYSSAVQRWKCYEQQLEPFKSKLARWIQEYGYLS